MLGRTVFSGYCGIWQIGFKIALISQNIIPWRMFNGGIIFLLYEFDFFYHSAIIQK